MISFGIIDDKENIANALTEIFEADEESEIRIERIGGLPAAELEPDDSFDILIVNDGGDIAAPFIKQLRESDLVIMNTDNKSLFRYLRGAKGKLITYGFNSKACVTASSVVDEAYETVQICIQRNIPTLSGKNLEQQEFSVQVQGSGQSIYSILAAVTAALVSDMPLEKIAVFDI